MKSLLRWGLVLLTFGLGGSGLNAYQTTVAVSGQITVTSSLLGVK
jgi:hypothetical protein